MIRQQQQEVEQQELLSQRLCRSLHEVDQSQQSMLRAGQAPLTSNMLVRHTQQLADMMQLQLSQRVVAQVQKEVVKLDAGAAAAAAAAWGSGAAARAAGSGAAGSGAAGSGAAASPSAAAFTAAVNWIFDVEGNSTHLWHVPILSGVSFVAHTTATLMIEHGMDSDAALASALATWPGGGAFQLLMRAMITAAVAGAAAGDAGIAAPAAAGAAPAAAGGGDAQQGTHGAGGSARTAAGGGGSARAAAGGGGAARQQHAQGRLEIEAVYGADTMADVAAADDANNDEGCNT